MDFKETISSADGFDWDKGNLEKNWVKHRVSQPECEQVFFSRPISFFEDPTHFEPEGRYCVLGQTDQQRLLFLVFIMRENKIRVISARDMSRKERKEYKSYEKENTSF